MFANYGRNFWLICFSMLLFTASFNLILPELNQFITDLGGEGQKGLIISLFTVSAGLSRPFSGKLSDTIGRKTVILIGIAVSFLVTLLYPISFSVWFFLFLRFLHGFSAGFSPTGATALITDILPADRRGQGMGIWGTFFSLGIGVGQSLGSYIEMELGMNNLFMIASGTAVIAGILVFYVEETLLKEDKQPFQFKLLLINGKDVVEPSVFPAAIVMFLTATCSGIIFVLTPDMSSYLGINNKGWFFGIYVISTILVRLFTGTLSDKIGRRKTLLIGVTFLIVSMLLIGYSTTMNSYSLAAIIFGIATGISSPTLFAWTADLSNVHRRGVGAGTMFIALELGVFVGSLSTLFTYDNTSKTIPDGFWVGAILAFCAFIYLIWHLKRRQSAT